jgi:biotin carboxylase
MMNLRDKRLLLMGGGAYVKGIKKYADEQGFYMIAVGSSPKTALKDIADEFYQIDTQDVNAVTALVKEKKIDGIFVGSSEVNIDPAITVSERTGVHFYAKRQQWDIISNKARFKEYARQYGVPVTKDYHVTSEFLREDLDAIQYPVIVKPVDSSGARGVNACYNEDELKKYYLEALKWSKGKEVIVEELITGAQEVFFHYTIQDGIFSLSMGFTKFKVESKERDYVSLPIFHMYPSSHIDQYIKKVDAAAKQMFQSIGLKDGIVMLQGFDKGGDFSFFESGYRMGGEQMYILTAHQNGINSLEMMINYALTGKMADFDIREKDNPHFKWPCCNYYIALKPGIITEVYGLEEIECMSSVLNVTKMFDIGDEILDTNALERVCLRVHVYGKTPEELAQALVDISATLQILDQNGNEMQLEHLKYDRCLKAILNT